MAIDGYANAVKSAFLISNKSGSCTLGVTHGVYTFCKKPVGTVWGCDIASYTLAIAIGSPVNAHYC